jgi:hypothetical protein
VSPRLLRAGLRVAMRHQRQGLPSERAALQELIAAGQLVLRVQEAEHLPAPAVAAAALAVVPPAPVAAGQGLLRVWPRFARTELAGKFGDTQPDTQPATLLATVPADLADHHHHDVRSTAR